MTAQAYLLLNRGNDETVSLTLTQSDGVTPYNLTGTTINFYIKPGALTKDTDSSVFLLSTTTGGVTITDAQNGKVQVAIPDADLTLPVGKFWRIDIVQGSINHTAMFGNIQVGYR